MKTTLLALTLLACAAGAQAGGAVKDGSVLPFDLNDGRNIQSNLPAMKHIKDYFQTTRGATFKSDLPCSASGNRGGNIVGGYKLFALQTGKVGAWEGCAQLNYSGADVVIWSDGSDSMIPKENWEGFIPNYMK